MAVKIARQANRIAILGAPVSAAAPAPGGEGAPAALRKAGLVPKLQSIGYEVADRGDDPQQVFQPDGESPRARNVIRVLASLESLRPRVELTAKSGALPLILGGDCSIALGVVAGLRRYFRHVSIIYADCDADLQTPATTPSGYVDGMVVSHLAGRGASELVRFWSDPPLVRDPDIALFGVARLDPAEEQALQTFPLRRFMTEDVRRKGPARAAAEAVQRVHADVHEFVLHLDVDVIAGFEATNVPNTTGLRLEEVREALELFAVEKHLAAIEVAGYNPLNDRDGSGATIVIDLLAHILTARFHSLKEPAKESAAVANDGAAPDTGRTAEAAAGPGAAWSSDMLESHGSEEGTSVESAPDAQAFDGPEEQH